MASSAELLAVAPLAAIALKRRREMEQQRQRHELDLHQFVVEAWPILEPSIPFIDGPHLQLLCAHLEAISRGDISDLLINIPPGLTKSNLCAVLWPAWSWTRWPHTRWITASYDQALSIRDAVRTRRLMLSEWYQDQWGRQFTFSSDENMKTYFSNASGGWRLATSMRGAATGYHAQCVLVDDPHLVSKAESDLEREAVLTAWREVFPSRRLPGGARVVIGQRVHEEDISADWLAREGEDVHHLELAMEYAPDQARASQTEPCPITGEPHEWRTEPGELLAPDRFPLTAIERLRIDLGEYAYSGQFDQRPTPRAGMVLNPAWFVDRPEGLDISDMDVVAAFDLNYSEKDSSDWTIGIVAAVERTGDLATIHLLDIYAEHLAEERHDVELANYIEEWKPVLIGIEKRAFERQGATRDLIRNIQRLLAGRHEQCAIEPVEADSDKVSRAVIISGRAKAGLISVDRRASWWHPLSTEMSRFPRSQHDDRIDALGYLVRLAVERLAKVRALRIVMSTPATIRHTAVLAGGRRSVHTDPLDLES